MTFYDSHGKATAYLHDDGIHIYLFNGRPVAYLYYHNVNKKDSRLTALIVLCICTYLYLKCHCNLLHDHVI